jgi:hypothetical protein
VDTTIGVHLGLHGSAAVGSERGRGRIALGAKRSTGRGPVGEWMLAWAT